MSEKRVCVCVCVSLSFHVLFELALIHMREVKIAFIIARKEIM